MKNIIVYLLGAIVLTSCGAPGYQGTSTVYDSRENGKMIIQNASLRVSTRNTDSLNAQLTRLATKYEGYAVTIGNDYSVIRVKSQQLDAALKDIATLVKVKSKSVSGRDVTEEYRDYEIRFDNATKARQRYLELLSKAENVEAMLKVEKELERLNGEIDLLKGNMGKLEHLNEYATISLNITQKKKLGILGHVVVTLYKGVKWLFVRD
jgi:hypothetical protein